jgi:protein-S-isoprenylcysteine O-methyltransferase Ste14
VYWVRRIQFWGPSADGKPVREEQDDRSFWFIVLGMISAFYLPPLEYLYANPLLPRGVWLEILGWLLIVLGSVLFIWARRALGEFYSGHVSVIEGQPLVQSGPYRLIRHPAYAGYLLIALGVAVGYSSLAGLAAFLFLLSTVVYRIRVEDRLLAEHFGPQFARYARKTKRLVPWIW